MPPALVAVRPVVNQLNEIFLSPYPAPLAMVCYESVTKMTYSTIDSKVRKRYNDSMPIPNNGIWED